MGGSVSPSKMPVIMADQSLIVVCFLDILHRKCSVSTAAAVVDKITSRALMPKVYVANNTKGSIAHTTFCIITSVLIPFVICGEVLILSVLFSIC